MKFTLYTADCTGNEKNTHYPHKKVITSEADLKKAIVADHVCALYDNFSRSEVNFQLSDVVPMDCDNDHSDNTDEWITAEKLSEILSDVAFAITYSRHHMLPKGTVSARPRFHVLFPTSPCKDAAIHKSIKARIFKELPFFDGNALDASRFLFGTKGDVFWHEGSLTIEDWLLLMKQNNSIPQGQRKEELGFNLVYGLAEGVDDKVKTAVRAVNAMGQDVMTAAEKSLNMSWNVGDFVPSGGTSVVNNYYNNDNSRTVNQTNNSPKALSRLEIYRLTRNAVKQ